MRMTAEALYALLPAIYRTRDAEEGHPLRELVAVIAEQAAIVEENIEQLLDDQFIETCADWAAPYIGGLIGYQPLYGVAERVLSPRAEIANTIGYRRRLGTASVLEQLARDVTGWPARAVEYFQTTATTQRMNHIRPGHHFAPDLRNGRGLEAAGGAFDPFTRLADMRSIERADGRFNFPNVGIALWRLAAFERAAAPAFRVDDARWLFSPLGAPLPLFVNPVEEPTIIHVATPLNVPAPISRRALHGDLAGADGQPPARALYGRSDEGLLQSLSITLNGVELGPDAVESCNLSDIPGGWANLPQAGEPVAIDPVLGRIALPPDRAGPVVVSFHYGFSAPIGGGAYERAAPFAVETIERPLLVVPSATHPTIQSALDDLPLAGGIVEVRDNGVHSGAIAIAAGAGAAIELRAANGANPHLALAGDLVVRGGAEARVTIDGFLISRGAVVIPDDGANALERLTLRHCTLVPGRTLDAEGLPVSPGAQSVEAALPGVDVVMASCISGAIGLARGGHFSASDSIIDAAARDAADSRALVAFADPAGTGFGGAISLDGTMVFGKVAAERFDLVSNSLIDARLAVGDAWPAPVWAERRQVGCVRFSFIPAGSITPRRYRCQPQLAIDSAISRARERQTGVPLTQAQRATLAQQVARRMVPAFTSRRFGRPAYAQLRRSVPREIRAGASDEAEMGALHQLFAPQRETNLRIRLEEYLRFALEAGAFFET